MFKSFYDQNTYPIWKLSHQYAGKNESRVILPIADIESKFIEKVLLCSKDSSNIWKYKVLSLENFEQTIVNSNKATEKETEEYFSFMFISINEKFIGEKLPCTIGQNVHLLTENFIANRSKMRTDECVFISSFSGYCWWGGTPSNPYAYFGGCEGSTTTVYVCDNPDAVNWSQVPGVLGGQGSGGGSAPAPDPGFISGNSTDGTTGLPFYKTDCRTFNFVRLSQTANALEAAIKVQLFFAASDGPTLKINLNYLRFTAAYKTQGGRIVTAGEAANAAARAFDYAFEEANETYIAERNTLSSAGLYAEVNKVFKNRIDFYFGQYLGAYGKVNGTYTELLPASNYKFVPYSSTTAYNCQ